MMDDHIISSQSTILEALGRLNDLSGGVLTLFVTEPDGTVTGSLTDGDIRRGLLAGHRLEEPVTSVMHSRFKSLRADAPDLGLLRSYRESGVRLLPLVDDRGHLTDIIDTTATPTRLPLSAILMAGGKGERLRPMTLTTPKPLLSVGGKAIIDYNIEALGRAGITDVSVTVNYLADKLEEHFARPVGGVKVRCVREEKPLGTMGSAALVELPACGDTLVMNSDLLTTISFEDMYLWHRAEKADITMAVIPYNVSVPYAILSTDGSRVKGLEEKPSYAYYANAGIYIMPNRLLSSLPLDRRTDATDLIEQAIADGLKVVYFPHFRLWIDIGSPADFRHACELMEHREML